MTSPTDSAAGPQLLPPNQVAHFYQGGDRIKALRGTAGGPYGPEEWIASVTPMAGQDTRGLSWLAGGTLLRDAILADPQGWLGPAHLDRYGSSTELLVKLLDAGERLPVHVHPDRAFSRAHLGLPHGKTEAWVVLDAVEGAQVRLGFAEPMRLAQVRALVDAEDTDALVAALRGRPVRPGDAVLVPAGLPHCIDAGIFVLELQEPTDLSVLLEWAGFAIDGRRDGHLGLGFDVALRALSLDVLDQSDLDSLVLPREQVEAAELASLLPSAADAYFRVHRLRSADPGFEAGASFRTDLRPWSGDPAFLVPNELPGTAVDAGFSVVLVTSGTGELLAESGDRLPVRRGDAAVVPWRAGRWRLAGAVEALVCRPPSPQHPGAAA